jgi:hypothetical protein
VTGDPVRDEAERLVAAAIAAFSLAARGLGGVAGSRRSSGHSGFATGSPECCVCPVCRVISAMRDPSPELAERLASGAGDLASVVTGILRSLSRAGVRPNPPDREGDEFWDNLGRRAREESRPPSQPTGSGWPGESSAADDDPWRAATRSAAARDDDLGPDVSDHDLLDDAILDGDAPPYPASPVKPPAKMAKKAVRKAAPPPPPTTPMARKAVKKAAPPAPPPPTPTKAAPGAAKATPGPVPAKKVAKKAAKKAAPGGAEG